MSKPERRAEDRQSLEEYTTVQMYISRNSLRFLPHSKEGEGLLPNRHACYLISVFPPEATPHAFCLILVSPSRLALPNQSILLPLTPRPGYFPRRPFERAEEAV